MSSILAVFGATGKQGSSVVNYVLNDPELSRKYKIRAITRDVNSEKAKKLEEKVEVVRGDVLDRSSLGTALAGVHTVFAVTTPFATNVPLFGPKGLESEYNQAKNIADAAVEQGAQYIIFSTLPSPTKISGGKWTSVTPFDAKEKAEQYIRGLPIKSAFVSPGGFMENYVDLGFWSPKRTPDGGWILVGSASPKAEYPLVDAVGNTGNFVGAILAEPDKYEGKIFHAATALYSWEEIAAIISKATGKNVVYKQTPVEELEKMIPFGAEVFIDGFQFMEEFGYYGPDSRKLIAWAVDNARGKLTTFEEYLSTHPVQME
ncbi:uncharacterized protein F4822DRAFT_441937 [Hypoxylon trugodes]|uniref:uncharacterized protein n=1 Tax=Hypoxylon trugodes TaxID=326681 RepID=UPI00219A8898|nr:uncharacterized protein F4822DRAFT_441937 [Hypoxylon trugodes]KAI1390641.1 hypothetical protein F4822DRAFT_441937 [Hypoxylon trugodes]